MMQAQNGHTVSVHYTGRLADDSVFDSSREGEPLTFTLGAGQVIEGFEQGILGMAPGQIKTITVPAEEAYGPYEEGLVLEVERNQFPAGLNPAVGQQYQLEQPNGDHMVVTVANVTPSHIVLDANHPLAGKDLTFEIELVQIQ